MASNPYTPPTLSNYNANPPPDDGSQTAVNEVAWVTHTDKIGDPLRNFSNAIDAEVESSFAKTINTDADENNSVAGSVAFTSSELTIAAGSVAAVRSHHTIDTQNDDAADDLDTITVAGVNDGTVLMLRLENAARVVTLKDNTGNIQTKNNEDIVLDANIPTILLRVGTDWFEIQRPVVDNPFDQDLNIADNPEFAGVHLGGSGAANLLDDYEEGTWTPSIQDTSFSDAEGQTYGTRAGKYTKVGDKVTVWGDMTVTSLGTISGTRTFIGGLPFAHATGNFGPACNFADAQNLNLSTAGHSLTGRPESSTIELIQWNSTAGTGAVAVSELSGTMVLRFTHIYFV